MKKNQKKQKNKKKQKKQKKTKKTKKQKKQKKQNKKQIKESTNVTWVECSLVVFLNTGKAILVALLTLTGIHGSCAGM